MRGIAIFSMWFVAVCLLAGTPACDQFTTADVLGTPTPQGRRINR
jgi:hypothetical protein